MEKLLGSWIWYELMTKDAAGAKTFYESAIGWTITPGAEPPLFYGHIARADGRQVGGVLPLSEEMLSQGAHPMWVGYIGVDDLDATLAQVLARGGRALMPHMDIPEGSFAMVMDPWGASFYLMQPNPGPDAAPSVAFSATEAQSVGWNELYTGDFDAALAFYTEIFGWEPAGSMDMGSYGTYQFLGHNGVTIGAMMPKPPHVSVGGWNHYIRAADFDAAHQAALAGGANVLHGPVEVPGGDWIINALDPQGAAFAIVGQKLV
ncbi:hypothetical protein FHW96_000116 [Novosphingobium sp. SG751A]|uniref:VOC family protein n=1 Tax=Novosphingobium sp. SG751A TaxID=2587000 RepID=UPI0015548873|nr:VOC family protein [Novosphingobium sp. SG751A]NOW43989.1 hypothetical protein [Novosphingobium sp. SG751A]